MVRVSQAPTLREKPLVVQSSFTARIYQDAIDVFANTLPYVHQETMMTAQMTEPMTTEHYHPQSGVEATPKEDFSIFCDQPTTQSGTGGVQGRVEGTPLEVEIPTR